MISDQGQQKLAHLLGCGVPRREAEVVAAGAQDNPVTLAVRDFCAGSLTFCLLIGRAGTGKSIAASEALLNSKMAWDGGKSWCYSPSEAKFVLAADLSRLSYFEQSAIRLLGRVERVPWLVLDDLGSEMVTEGWKTGLAEIIQKRNSDRRRTIITTNLSVEMFKERYDERIVSRIRGDGVVINAGAEDLRRPS